MLNRFIGVIKSNWNSINDFALGIETSTFEIQKNICNLESEYKDNYLVQNGGYSFMRKMLKLIRPARNDVFFDIGAGIGRMICLAAQWRVKKCVGIELVDACCKTAEKNSMKMRWKKSNIEIRCGDAAEADLSEGTIYYLYNPFGEGTMEQVLSNLRKSLDNEPRKIRMIYCRPVHETLFKQCNWLEKYYEYHYKIIGSKQKELATFWKNKV